MGFGRQNKRLNEFYRGSNLVGYLDEIALGSHLGWDKYRRMMGARAQMGLEVGPILDRIEYCMGLERTLQESGLRINGVPVRNLAEVVEAVRKLERKDPSPEPSTRIKQRLLKVIYSI